MSWERTLKSLAFVGLVMTAALLVSGLAKGRGLVTAKPAATPPASLSGTLSPPPPPPKYMAKEELADLLGPRDLEVAGEAYFEIFDNDGQPLFVQTTLDPDLQTKAQRWVNASGAIRAALVVLDPANGKILALAGAGNPEGNAALESGFPAASVFKIVTAAAAVERANFNAMTTVAYDGAKHTLYKANLAKGPDEGLHKATLKDGFAESINSVFGKLGAFSLLPSDLEEMAESFGFNESLAFELPLSASSFALGDDPEDTFRLAELASGFNRETRLSPVHGALIASIALNGGDLYEPTIISQVSDINDKVLYRNRPTLLGKAVSLQTSEEISLLMQAALSEGTGRKHFSDVNRNPVLSKLILGGKSGTINDENGSKVDWFVAFAAPADSLDPDPATQDSLALAAVIVHDGRVNLASQELVRKALLAYYSPRLKAKPESNKAMAGGQKPQRSKKSS
ncbi:MAG: hypothetical protein LBJ61_06010 [Deltaproteobacteria bacterium]|jgi:cell division protein FtsI/penicillin-binding protein 2|nr:hypothetical protein [Deltaproteobacteria bacterium]